MIQSPWCIIGDGLAATVLALTCHRQDIAFVMSGASIPGAASYASSGLINPITGRRYVKSWMVDELIEEASGFYSWTDELFGQSHFRRAEIARFLPNDEARQAWADRLADPAYATYISGKRYPALDERDVAYGVVTNAFVLDTPGWLRDARAFLAGQGYLVTGSTSAGALTRHEGPVIRSVGAYADPLPPGLIPNKGEALIVRMPEWGIPIIVRTDVFIVPLKEASTYWVGSGYERGPANPWPTESERTRLMGALRKVHPGPIEMLDHLAGVRPTTKDRRPLVGADPDHPGDYIFNGLGTKGTSLAPYWSMQLIRHIRDGHPLSPEVDPARFAR